MKRDGDDRLVRRDLKLAEEAASWLHRLQTDGASAHEEYSAWLLESPRHVEAFLRVAEMDASLQRVDPRRLIRVERVPDARLDGNVVGIGNGRFEAGDRLPEDDGKQDDSAEPHDAVTSDEDDSSGQASPRSQESPGTPRRWAAALAACIALIGLATASMWAFGVYQASRWHVYATVAGAGQSFTLSDGSLLRLAPSSRVAVRFRDGERSLRLELGEALFKVHHDTSRPFRVSSGGVVVEAVGTEFTVRHGARVSVVSVLEGRVRVKSAPNAVRTEHQPPGKVAEPLYLAAGEQARIDGDGRLEGHGKADPSLLVMGQDHRLVFVDERLDEVVEEFNRFNPALQIRLDASSADLVQYFTGSFEADDPESLLAVLERNPALTIEREGDGVLIRAKQ